MIFSLSSIKVCKQSFNDSPSNCCLEKKFYYPCIHVPPKHGALPLSGDVEEAFRGCTREASRPKGARRTGNGAWQRGLCRRKLLCELSILSPELYHQVPQVLLFVLHIDITGSICWFSTRDRTGIQVPQPNEVPLREKSIANCCFCLET